MELARSTVLVTGASGFVGGHLALRLAAEGARVRALVRPTSRVDHLDDSPIQLHHGDITNPGSLGKAMKGVDIVFHCAALVRDWGPAEDFQRINVQGTENVLAAAIGAGVKHFVHTSSVAVYGLDPAYGADESHPAILCGYPYADSKIEAEERVMQTHQQAGLTVAILRPGDVYGPRSISGTLGPLVAIKLGWLELVDGGSGICNHLYISNLVDAYILAARRDRGEGAAYTITDGVGTTWREFWGRYARMVGKASLPSIDALAASRKAAEMEAAAVETRRPPLLTRTSVAILSRRAVFSIDKARRELGYKPRVSLDDGMARTEAWLREQGYL